MVMNLFIELRPKYLNVANGAIVNGSAGGTISTANENYGTANLKLAPCSLIFSVHFFSDTYFQV